MEYMSDINPIISTYSQLDRRKLMDYELSKRKGVVVLEDFDGYALIGITRSDNYVVLGVVLPHYNVKTELVMYFYSVDDYIKHDNESIARTLVHN